jgi:Flp pilus assembly protein CpaB
MKSIKPATTAVLIVLIILAAVMVTKLATREEPEIKTPTALEPAKSRIVAKRELQAFTLLKDEDLEARLGSAELGQKAPDVKGLIARYVLVNLKKGAEVKDEMVAPPSATPLLSDAVAISIPVTATTFPGGQLRAGDLVDLVAVRSKESTEVKKFESLMVLSILQANKDTNLPNAIALAIPSAQRDAFASAVVGAELLLTRRILVGK